MKGRDREHCKNSAAPWLLLLTSPCWKGHAHYTSLKYSSLAQGLSWAPIFEKEQTQEKLWKPRSYALVKNIYTYQEYLHLKECLCPAPGRRLSLQKLLSVEKATYPFTFRNQLPLPPPLTFLLSLAEETSEGEGLDLFEELLIFTGSLPCIQEVFILLNFCLFFSYFYYKGVLANNLDRYTECHEAKTGSLPCLHNCIAQAHSMCRLSARGHVTEQGERPVSEDFTILRKQPGAHPFNNWVTQCTCMYQAPRRRLDNMEAQDNGMSHRVELDPF